MRIGNFQSLKTSPEKASFLFICVYPRILIRIERLFLSTIWKNDRLFGMNSRQSHLFGGFHPLCITFCYILLWLVYFALIFWSVKQMPSLCRSVVIFLCAYIHRPIIWSTGCLMYRWPRSLARYVFFLQYLLIGHAWQRRFTENLLVAVPYSTFTSCQNDLRSIFKTLRDSTRSPNWYSKHIQPTTDSCSSTLRVSILERNRFACQPYKNVG